MSKYYVNKFLYTVDRDPRYLDAYAEDPKEFVGRWEDEIGPQMLNNSTETVTVHAFTELEREALINHDYVALFEMGAHFFLSLTLFVGVYDAAWTREKGPLSFQREFASRLNHWLGEDYPSVSV